MSNNLDNIEAYENKSFDQLIEDARNAWKQATTGLFKLKKLIPAIFEKGRTTGMSDDDIRATITGQLGVPYRTMLRYIPEDAKQQQKRYHDSNLAKVATFSNTNQVQTPIINTQLTDVKPITIPSPEQPIIDQEPEPDQAATEVAEEYQRDMQRQQEIEQTADRLLLAREFKMYIKLLDSFAVSKAKGWTKKNGLDYIVFRINKNGEFYIPS